jgi:hypothetical protein
MASNTGFLSTTELDFTAIKSNLITYLKSQDQFADYNFEASNFNVLLDVLSYNTYLNSFYLNMVGSEMFLDTTQLRESAVSHSKELNYLPRSKTSAVAYVNISVDPGTRTPDYITIPKFYAFSTQLNGTTIYYTVPDDILIRPVNGVYAAANVAIYEGSVVEEYFNVAANTNTFTLQSENLDTRSVTVYVYESSISQTSYLYTMAESLFGLDGTSNVYFMQGYADTKYQITFGNDVTGRQLTNGNVIKVQYRDTIGEPGNGSFIFRKGAAFTDVNNNQYTGISVSTVKASAEGSDRESIDSIKFNAPRYFPTQGRSITAQDYIALTKAKFPQLQAVNAYGGEELIPPQYGRVAISVKPYGTVGLVSNSLKVNIVNYLKLKNLTTEPIVVDPEFFYIDIVSVVHYNSSMTSKSSAQLKALVENAIINYGLTNLTEFGSDLRYSKMISDIDNSDAAITSNETKLNIIRRWNPEPGIKSTLSYSFDNELAHETVFYSIPAGHEQSLSTDFFTYTHTDNQDYVAYIGDDGLGVLNIYTNQVISGVSTRTILQGSIGTVNYFTGDILFTATVKSYTGNYINIYGIPKGNDIYSIKNKFLIIESTDISITMNDIVKA